DQMPKPSCVSCQLGSPTTTRFTRTRLSDIVHPVSSSQLTQDPDRVRSFGGYNSRLPRISTLNNRYGDIRAVGFTFLIQPTHRCFPERHFNFKINCALSWPKSAKIEWLSALPQTNVVLVVFWLERRIDFARCQATRPQAVALEPIIAFGTRHSGSSSWLGK